MSSSQLAPGTSELVASLPADGGQVLLFTFAYPFGSEVGYASLVTVTAPDLQCSGRSGKIKFDDWCFVGFPSDWEAIPFEMPNGCANLLYPETVMVHACGLMLCGPNRFVRHWLDVFLRERLPPHTCLGLDYTQLFLVHLQALPYGRTFVATHDGLLQWRDEPYRPGRPAPLQAKHASRVWGAQSSTDPPSFCNEDQPHFAAPGSSAMTADEWLLHMLHPSVREIARELDVLMGEQAAAQNEVSGPPSLSEAHLRTLAVVQGRTLSASLLVTTLLDQWESIIEPTVIPAEEVADDAECGDQDS